MFTVRKVAGLVLSGWYIVFCRNKELIWMRIVQFSRLLVEQPKHGQQLLYCTLLLFLYCLHDYCITLEPGILAVTNSCFIQLMNEGVFFKFWNRKEKNEFLRWNKIRKNMLENFLFHSLLKLKRSVYAATLPN